MENQKLASTKCLHCHCEIPQIATAAEQQYVTSEEIKRNINDIQSTAEQTASGVKQTESASPNLGKLGLQLQTRVEKFKV